MTKERQICVRPILDKIVSFIYRCIGYVVILIMIFLGVLFLFFIFIYPYYQEYDYMILSRIRLHEELSAGRSF